MTVEAVTHTCPSCGSQHLVEDNDARHLCLDCHSLSQEHGSRLVTIQRQCQYCSAENPAKAALCEACGNKLVPACLHCKAAMTVWQATCPRCGTDQAAYREKLVAEEQERQRQEQAQQVPRRRYYPPVKRRLPRRGFWRIGWMFWPMVWLVANFGRRLWESLESLSTQQLDLSVLSQLPDELFPLAIGACIFSVGAVVFLLSALPRILRSD